MSDKDFHFVAAGDLYPGTPCAVSYIDDDARIVFVRFARNGETVFGMSDRVYHNGDEMSSDFVDALDSSRRTEMALLDFVDTVRRVWFPAVKQMNDAFKTLESVVTEELNKRTSPVCSEDVDGGNESKRKPGQV